MQGPAHGAGAGIQLGRHALDALAQSGSVQVHAEHVDAAVELLQAAHVLGALLDLQRGHDGLQFFQQGVGRGLEGPPGIVHPLFSPLA